MNYEHLKKKMDEFFNSFSPEDIIKEFEKRGYKFVDISEREKQNSPVLIGHLNRMIYAHTGVPIFKIGHPVFEIGDKYRLFYTDGYIDYYKKTLSRSIQFIKNQL